MEADDRRFEETVKNLFIGEGNVVSVGPVWLLMFRWRACCQHPRIQTRHCGSDLLFWQASYIGRSSGNWKGL